MYFNYRLIHPLFYQKKIQSCLFSHINNFVLKPLKNIHQAARGSDEKRELRVGTSQISQTGLSCYYVICISTASTLLLKVFKVKITLCQF